MARAIEEWRGKTDDQAIPPRVRLRIFECAHGHCQKCSRKIMAGERWDVDHIVPLIAGGEHCETNMQVLCVWCHKDKTRVDASEKSAVYKTRSRHVGIKKKSTFGCARDGKWKKLMNGQVVRR